MEETAMSIRKLREELLQARQAAAAGDTAATVQRLDDALRELEPPSLVTTAEAARLLGVRSVNTIKFWCKTGYLHGIQRGGRTLIPIAEIERIHDSDHVRAVRAADAMHDAIADFGVEEGLTDEQLADLASSRPGTLPWKRAQSSVAE
jgi:hypothetical protein